MPVSTYKISVHSPHQATEIKELLGFFHLEEWFISGILKNQSSLSFTPNWFSFQVRKLNDEFMIINLIQTLFNRLTNEQIFSLQLLGSSIIYLKVRFYHNQLVLPWSRFEYLQYLGPIFSHISCFNNLTYRDDEELYLEIDLLIKV